jgi:hypothetical protein
MLMVVGQPLCACVRFENAVVGLIGSATTAGVLEEMKAEQLRLSYMGAGFMWLGPDGLSTIISSAG